MSEPIGALLGVIAETMGMSGDGLRLLLGSIGMLLLALSFHRHGQKGSVQAAAAGWILLGLFVYLRSEYYVKIDDPLLILMTAMALPGGILLAMMEIRDARNEVSDESLVWFRGMVAWAMIPYHLVYSIPFLNIAVVMLTASSAEWMLEFAGMGQYTLGEVMVELHDGGEVTLSAWGGNMWILTEPLGEGGFFVEMFHADGTSVHISFILSCSGLQSMIIFVGAIAALRTVPLNRRLRGLFIAVPTIHVLNTFRNAGIVWLSHSYSDWIFMDLNMFDFAHSYAAKAASLFAMFLMAIALFDLLPELHRHIMRFIPPSLWPKKQESVSES